MKKTKGFGLLGVIVIIIITAIVSSIATGVIMLNNTSSGINNSKINITNDKDLQKFIEIYETLTTKYYEGINKEELLDAAKEGMSEYLGDKYTTFLGDSEYEKMLEELSGNYDGIGIRIQANKVISVTLNSPADKAGIKKNDNIISINGINVENMDANFIGNLIKKDNNKIVNLEIKRNDEIIKFTIEKEKLPTITYYKIDDTNIGYLYIENFSEDLSTQVSKALTELEKKGINSLIIDVRDNVGGYLSAAEDTASLFLENGKVIYSLRSNNNEFAYNDKTTEKREYPIAVLINGGSASAAEILAAALKESYNATLIGTKSYGKGKVQQVIDSFKFTSAEWLTPLGKCIDGVGITPDYNILYENTGIYDSQLNKAIEILQK